MKSIIKIALPAFLSAAVVGCSKFGEFGDMNINPNATEVPSSEALLTNALISYGGTSTETRGGLYSQQFSETQYTEVSLYSDPVVDFTGTYSGPLMDFVKVIELNEDPLTAPTAAKFGPNANQIGISKISKAFFFWTVTDKFGHAPYTESLQINSTLSPKYDDPETIYKGVMTELTDAVNLLNTTATSLVTGDIIGAGSGANWARYGNSLRMLVALRTSNVYPSASGWAATEFKKAFEDAKGYITTNAQSMRQTYPGNTAGYSNAWWQTYNNRSDYAMSDVIGNLMTDIADPRVPAYGSSTIFFPYGVTRDSALKFVNEGNSLYARIFAPAQRTTTTPVVIVSAATVAFAIAEAAELGWINEDPAQWLAKGIELAWTYYGVGDVANIPSYITSAKATTGYNDLEFIQLQQYLAYYGNGLQAWSNWRRTRIPALTPTPFATNASKQIPERYIYPAGEYSLNEASVRAAAANYNNDSPDAKVWWSK
jgi:hypothetical protein